MIDLLRYLGSNLWWPFIGGVILGAVCVAGSRLLGRIGRRT